MDLSEKYLNKLAGMSENVGMIVGHTEIYR